MGAAALLLATLLLADFIVRAICVVLQQSGLLADRVSYEILKGAMVAVVQPIQGNWGVGGVDSLTRVYGFCVVGVALKSSKNSRECNRRMMRAYISA